MFLENFVGRYHAYDNLQLIITSDKAGDVNIQCPGINLTLYKTISVGVQHVEIDKAARSVALRNERKGIRLISTVNISVYAMNMRQYESEGYTALPVEAIGKRYVIVTYKPNRKSLIGIAATDDHTVVSIHLNSSAPLTIEGVPRNRTSGPFQIVLNDYHTFEIGHNEDLSGTVIESDKDISVITGNQCGTTSSDPGCQHLCEQVPPISSWGRNFIVPRISNVTGSFIRIVAAYGYTYINVTRKSIRKSFSIVDPNYLIHEDVGIETVSVEASKPIYVLLVPKYSGSYNSFMVSIPAIEQYTHYYHIATPLSGFSSHYMTVLINSKKDQLKWMRLDNNHLAENPSNEETVVVKGEDYTALTVAIKPANHRITNLLRDTRFGLLVYGFGPNQAYGYPGGMNVHKL